MSSGTGIVPSGLWDLGTDLHPTLRRGATATESLRDKEFLSQMLSTIINTVLK